MTEPKSLLEVEALRVSIKTPGGHLTAVHGVSFSLGAGEVLTIVGESGSGKSLSARAIIGLLPQGAEARGSIKYDGRELIGEPDRMMRVLRGAHIAMIFQDPMTALNPVLTVGSQIMEAIRIHNRSASRAELRREAIRLLDLVSIPHASTRVDLYPHEFSGGMRQRATIAIAMANRPKILIADEPTTALDATVQAQIIEVLDQLRNEMGLSILLITHDLGVAASIADKVAVMYAGKIVEIGSAEDIFERPRHPYAKALLASLPSMEKRHRLYSLGGLPPALGQHVSGCAFLPRCKQAIARCSRDEPVLRYVGQTAVACHLADPETPQAVEAQSMH